MTAKTAPTPAKGEETPDPIGEIIQEPIDTPIVIDGIDCRVKRLRTRGFLALMRVLLRGVGGGVSAIWTGPPGQVADRFVGTLGVAIPQAEEHWIAFCRRMVEAVDPKQQERVNDALDDPSLDETYAIITRLAEQEGPEIVRLGKAAKGWWEMNQEQMKEFLTTEEE